MTFAHPQRGSDDLAPKVALPPVDEKTPAEPLPVYWVRLVQIMDRIERKETAISPVPSSAARESHR